jgi:hypothetical protein
MGLLGCPSPSRGLEHFRECSDSYVTVQDTGMASQQLSGKGHSRGTVARKAPSDGAPRGTTD